MGAPESLDGHRNLENEMARFSENIICHMSFVTSHMSCATCHLSKSLLSGIKQDGIAARKKSGQSGKLLFV